MVYVLCAYGCYLHGSSGISEHRAIRGRGPRMLAEGQIVRYHVIKNDRGLQADDVSIIE